MTPSARRVAICTGGGRGLGRAMALGLIAAGYKVAITAATNVAELESVANEGPEGYILPIAADVSNPSACEYVVNRTVEELGTPSILINNAGRGMLFVSDKFITEPTRFWETNPDTWQLIIDTNVNGPFYMARAVIKLMLAHGWGRIVNISMNRETMRRQGFSPYGPSKAALESATAIWAQDLQGTGITVNSLLPGGASDTGMLPQDLPPSVRERLIQPEIMVQPLLWLLSDSADGITGKRINAALWTANSPTEAKPGSAVETAGC